jgi:hypothetical protein
MKRLGIGLLCCFTLTFIFLASASAGFDLSQIKSESYKIAQDFSGEALQKLVANTQLAKSGALEKIKPLLTAFSQQLATFLLNKGNNSSGAGAWTDKVTQAMDTASSKYASGVTDIFSGKNWEGAAQEILKSFSGLKLDSASIGKIDNLIQTHFQQLSMILTAANKINSAPTDLEQKLTDILRSRASAGSSTTSSSAPVKP